MRVRDLPLSASARDHLADEGIEELYPPQAAAVEAGVLDGERVVAAVPTASGKTLIARLALLAADGPGLYIVPLRALAREKYETLDALPGTSVGISTGDLDAPAESLAGHDVVVATSEKVDAAIRNGADWIDDLACVVVDEVHLLGSENRGPTLEMTLAALRRRLADPQVVALSATVANPDEIAAWLDATLVESDWRPVDLRTGVHAGGVVRFDDGSTREVAVPPAGPDAEGATEATAALVADTVAEGGQALAFVRSRREAESLAERLAAEGFAGAAEVAADAAAAATTRTGRTLADRIRDGVAFHHAGLRSTHRAIVESAFRGRDLAAVCATPTLAAGVNVPARRVVVRDQRRFTGTGTEWLPVLEVHQMCGRAGRPGLDPHGEAVLVADEGEADTLRERYVGADPERVDSRLADPAALRTHVLSVVVSGFADSRAGVLDVLDASFHAHGTDEPLDDVVGTAVSDLAGMGMVRVDGPDLAATDLGACVSRQYVTPETGRRLVDGLETAAAMETPTALTALEIVCHTPDMRTGYLGNRERAAIYGFARERAAELTTGMGEADSFEDWLAAVRTARVLVEWAEGVDADRLVERYRVGPGDLESRVERATWLLGAADAVAGVIGVDLPVVGETRQRL